MERILGRFAPQCYALMRIAVGLLFACHGAQKLFGVLGGQPGPDRLAVRAGRRHRIRWRAHDRCRVPHRLRRVCREW